MLKILSKSSKETKEIAKDLAENLLKKPSENSALVIGLSGDLGAGKTTFIQGFLKKLGIRKKITSPTFVIIKRFNISPFGRSPEMRQDSRFKNIYHIDCYRFKKPNEILKLGFKELIDNPQNIVLIEWAEKIRRLLPKKNVIWLKFDYGEKENERKIMIK